MESLLDADADGLSSENPLQVFELQEFMGLGEKNVVPVLLYLFHRIERRLDGRPTLILLDEAWLLLGNPLFREKINDWLRTLRKANAAVVFATQSLSDIMNSPLKDVLLGNCPTKILLANAEANTDGVRLYYEALGLNSRQIELLALMTPKRHAYLFSPEGKRVFELGLGAVELAFTGAGSKEDIALARRMRKEYGERWPAEWLKARGLHGAAEYWMTCRPAGGKPQAESAAVPQEPFPDIHTDSFPRAFLGGRR